MIGSRQNQRVRRSCCSPVALPWTLVAFLSVISLGALFQLQLVSREAAQSKVKLKTLGEDISLQGKNSKFWVLFKFEYPPKPHNRSQ